MITVNVNSRVPRDCHITLRTMHENLISNSASSSHKKEQTGYNELMSLQVKYVVDRLIDRMVANIATKANYWSK